MRRVAARSLAVALLSSAALALNSGAQVAPHGTGFRAEYLAELSVSEDHLVRLAEAIPADKYRWRPATGVRSVSEVLLHIAGSNFNLPRVLGVASRDSMAGRDYDKSMRRKEDVVAALRASFVFLRRAIEQLPDSVADKKIPWFDGENSYRGVLYFMARHTGEHTGQLIAYARVNGIVPPWSEGN
jgi:uncharacterized damage-inducible protein DinB